MVPWADVAVAAVLLVLPGSFGLVAVAPPPSAIMQRPPPATSYDSLGGDELIRRVQRHSVTFRGRRDYFDDKDVESCLAQSVDEARWRYEALRALRGLVETFDFLRSMDEALEEKMHRAESGLTLEIEDLVQLAQLGGDLKSWTALIDAASPCALDRLRVDDHVLEEALCHPLPKALKQTDDAAYELNDAIFPELASARKEERAALRTVESVRRRIGAKGDAGESFDLDGRFVFAFKRGQQPKGSMVHGASRTGQTLYAEPTELVGPTNEWKAAKARTRAAETRALGELSEAVRCGLPSIHACLDKAAEFDAVSARAKFGERVDGLVPELVLEKEERVADSSQKENRGILRAKNLRHALLHLDQDQGDEAIVGNDVRLGGCGRRGGDDDGERSDPRCLTISGANAGGKTVLLKSIGLAAILARLGAPIPAKSCEISFFDPILAHVGDAQELGKTSTYVAHLKVVNAALNIERNALPLVLLDELGSGTDPAQGAALGSAVLEGLVDRGALVVATTHHAPIKQLAAMREDFEIAAMTTNFRCEYGITGESRAIDAAKRVGLPKDVVERAVDLLGSEQGRLDDLAAKLEEASASAQKAEVDARRAEAEAKRAIREAREARENAERAADAARAEAAREYEGKLAEILNSAPKEEVIRQEKQQARDDAQVSTARSRGLEPLQSLPPIGTRVVVLKSGVGYRKKGTVLSYAGKNAAKVSLDDFDAAVLKPLKLKAKDVALLDDDAADSHHASHKATPGGGDTAAAAATKRLSRRAAAAVLEDDSLSSSSGQRQQQGGNSAASSPAINMRTARNTVDLRGLTLEDAEIETDAFLHRAKAAGFQSAFILHGHGTGVLKKGIRSWLRSQSIAQKYNAAKEDDGGDAFTQVHFRIK